MISLTLPEALFYPLFQDAALSGIIADGKVLADAIPLFDVDFINETYQSQKGSPDFDLMIFLKEHFLFSVIEETGFHTKTGESAKLHIERLWKYLRREPEQVRFGSTMITLPHPYIVPGGRFNEIYYWDSYFTMLGLKVSGHLDMIEHMLDNFSYLIHEIGFIPNGNRTYFLSRSQPPFFSLMVQLLAEVKGDTVYLKYLESMEKEYLFWMKTEEDAACSDHCIRMENGEILNRYFDQLTSPRSEMYAADQHLAASTDRLESDLFAHIRAACESGWDFSSRWFENDLDLTTIHTGDILPVDLNCLLYHLELTIGKSYVVQNKSDKADTMNQKANKRKDLIIKYFWNEDKGYFFDYNFQKKRQTNSIHAAGIFPLCFGLVDDEIGKRALQYLKEHLLKDGGIVTTTIESGQQWDAPNGWAPLQWMAWIAAKNYNEKELANSIANRWTSLNEKVLESTGKMLEKYNVLNIKDKSGGGEYPVQDGFGWTNGVYLALKAEIH